MKNINISLVVLMFAAALVSCGGNKNRGAISNKTGYAYNRQDFGGFQVADKNKLNRDAGPGLVKIEGGVFVMGGSAVESPTQDYGSYNHKREITIPSFYMDETEVSNTNWLEYLNWIKTNFPNDYEYYYNEIPDTLVWRSALSYNEPYVDNYLRHPAYQDYPVVGVSWEQAQRYCTWRTDRVNERLLRDQNYMTSFAALNGTAPAGTTGTPAANLPTAPFNTSIYLNGQYDDKGTNPKLSLDPAANNAVSGTPTSTNGQTGVPRNVRLEDGVVKQPYRLPTEAEWEYAALGLIGNTENENISENKIYPWNGLGISSPKKATRGLILANFKRGKGDYMGVGGSLNDKGSLTMEVTSFSPNDFGLYNMAGNVSEWVSDVYRASTYEAADAFNPYRGNVFMDKKMDANGKGVLQVDKYNRPVYENSISPKKQTYAEKMAGIPAAGTTNFVADQRGTRDQINPDLYGEITLVNDKSRVYKGGSWNDQAMWLNPAMRRFMQQDESSSEVGFRCAMTMLGASEIDSRGKAEFKQNSPKVSRTPKRRP